MTAPAAQFKSAARRVAADLRHRGIIQTAMQKYEVVRDQRKVWFQDAELSAIRLKPSYFPNSVC